MFDFRRLLVAAALAAVVFINPGAAQSTCSTNNNTFAIALRNCTFASGVISWGHLVELGTPPQRLCLIPSTVINSTLVSQETLCTKSNTTEPHKCESIRGGFFNENTSTTWFGAEFSVYNDTRSNPTWDHFNAPGFTKVGYDKLSFPNANVALYGAGIALNQFGNNSNAGMIGLGKDSVFLNDAFRQARAASKSWSLDAGSQSLEKPRNGELVIGGWNQGRTDGSFSWTNVSNMAGDRPCPLRTKITGMTITLSNGKPVPIKSSAEVIEACIEPYDNLFRFTPGMLLNWKQITNFNETLLDVYSNQAANDLSFTELGLPYDSSRIGNWSLSITLDNGYMMTLPTHELLRPLLGWDVLGNKRAVPGITNMQILNVPTGEGEVPILGRIFLSRSYLSVNYESGQFGLALAAVDPPQPSSYIPFPCGNGSSGGGISPPPSPSSFPIYPVVGGVVGGVVLLVSLALSFWYMRRRKRNRQERERRAAQESQVERDPYQQDYGMGDTGMGMGQHEEVAEIYSQPPHPYSPSPKYNELSAESSRYADSPRSPSSDPGWSPHPGSPHTIGSPSPRPGRRVYEVPG